MTMKSGLKKGSQKEKEAESQRQREKETEMSAPLNTTSAGFMALRQTSLFPPHGGPISADERRRLFEVVP